MYMPFAADPEKNTIWDNTYEEEVNHTDSTKSSCEQTQETKSTDILNLTSIYSDESEEMSFNELSPPQIVYSDEAVTTAKTVNFNKNCVNTIFTNTKDSLIFCVKDSNTKTAMKKCSGNKTVDFTLRNDKTIYTENAMEITNSIGVKNELITHSKNDISLITPFNDTMDLTLAKSTIYMQNTMEITTSINKENVNPIINDISLVTPVESKLRSSRLKGNNSVKNIGIQSDKISKENVDVHIKNCSERAQVQSNQEQATMFNHCDMELTRSLSVMDIKENLIDSKFPSYTKRKTINSNRPDGDIKLTCTLPVLLENKRQVDNIENGVTCILDQSEADMECTTTLPFTNVIIPESGQQNKFNSKRKTIHFNESKGNMEFTTTSPVNVIKETCLPNDMKCTAIFPNRGNITENSIYYKQKSIHFNETVGNMDITDISESKNNHLQLKTSHINQPASEMESTICLPIKDININKESNNSDSKRRTIHFDQSECNMEFTSVLPVEEINAYSNVNSHCIPSEDMEFATLLNDNVIKARTTDTPIPKGETINFNQSAASVEFTDTLPIAAIEESKRICGLVSKRKTFYFDQRDGDMEFTTTLPIAEIKENKGKYGSDSKRRTIYFDQIEGDMEFTETLPITDIKENMVKYGLNSKRENICFDQLDNDMEFTAALPIADIKENKEKYDLNSKRRTIYFDRLEGNMELTDTLPIADIKENKVKDGLNSKRKTICFDQLEGDMEFTATFSGKENSEISGIKPVQSVHEDMEFRTAFLNKNAVKEKITDPQKAAIHFPQFEDDIEITTTLPSNKDIVYENTDIKQKTINFSQTEADMEFTNFPVKNEIFEEKDYERETIHSNTSKNNIELNLLTKMDSMKNDSELVRTMQFNQVHVEKQYTNKSTTDSFNNHNNNRNISLIDSDNQMEIIVNSEKTVPLPKIEENNAVKEYNDSMSDTSVANKDTSNNKRHSNGENDDDIKKRKIDDINWFEKNSKVPNMLLPVHKNVHDTLECSDESINNKITFFCDKNEKGSEVSNASSIVENKTNAKIDTNQIHSDISKEQKTGKISNSNILYSEPMRIKLRTPIPDFSANLNLQTLDDSVNLKLVPVSTPAASFQMNLTNMSSCTEDTQQLIYATFSKPESLKMLLGKESMPQESTNDILCAKNNITSDNMVKDNENSSHKCDESFKRNEKTFTTNQWNGTQKMSVVENAFLSSNFENNSTEAIRSNHIPEKTDSYDFMEINNENLLSALNNPKTERSCYIEDISLLALAPKDLDDLSLVGNTSNPVNNADLELVSEHKSSEQDQSSNSVSSCSSDYNNYTLRCHSVLANIQKIFDILQNRERPG
ncbi:hypothetical protein NQ314_007148 [Rhamnusium bicolor]|uniref:Kinetochore scaffold 1 n=1 Tax=Rhamnusium bicolor TaxID=1586634 RepID=A0AAV8YRU8_9CUCU|nr:hypothetical protein NQ314_007148 [Rhamnusium bicolor]